MGDPYTDVTVANYNLNPPPDDGSNAPDNEVTWAKHKTKLGDPLKTAIEGVNTNVGAAVDKLAGGITATGTNYTALASDQGKIIRATAALTITTADATVVGSPFVHGVLNDSSGTVTIDGSGSQTIDGESTITLPPGSGVVLSTDGTNWFTGGRGRIQGSDSFVTVLPRGYLSGLNISNNATDASHDIDISVGVARDNANSFNFTISATHTKRIDASWVSGSGNGGLASGVSLSNNTTYHMFLVDDGSGNTEAGFDTSITATNLLSDTGGSFYRRIGSVITDGSANILAFTQLDNEFRLTTKVMSIDDNAPGTSANLGTLKVPTGLKVGAICNVQVGNGQGVTYISSPDEADQAPSTSAAPLSTLDTINDTRAAWGPTVIYTNTSAQVRYRTSNASHRVRVVTIGWRDTRGRDD